MRFHQYAIIGLLFAVLTSALLGAKLYDYRQSEITREGNHMLSQHKVAFSGTVQEAREALDDSLGPYSIFRSLDETGLVRAVESRRLDLLDVPVHEGRRFRRGDQRVALVGALVPVSHNGVQTFYELGGVEYEVIGRLGRDRRSLVENDVIIADRSLLESPEGHTELIIDGPAIEQQAAGLPADRVTRTDSSVNRRASVDLVSPIVGVVVHSLVIVGAVFTGVLAGQLTNKRFRVGLLIGRSPIRLLAEAVLVFTVTGIVSGALSAFIGHQWFPELRGGFEPSVLVPVLIAAAAFLVAGLTTFTRGRAWK